MRAPSACAAPSVCAAERVEDAVGGSDGGSDLMREVAARRSDPMVLLSLLSCLVVLGMGPGCLKNHRGEIVLT